MDLQTILLQASSPDTLSRNNAETILNTAIETQYDDFMVALAQQFTNENTVATSRQLAGIFLKNQITAQSSDIKQKKVFKWDNCKTTAKDIIKKCILDSLFSSVSVVRHTAAQLIAAYGSIDVPTGNWSTLLPSLLGWVMTPDVIMDVKVAILQALGYFCEALDTDDLQQSDVNSILTAIVGSIGVDRPDDIRKAAITALNNSLVFATNSFEIEQEKVYIMQGICQAALSSSCDVRVKAFECMVTVATHYYEKLMPFIQSMFDLCLNALKVDTDEQVRLKAIEVWSVICEREAYYTNHMNIMNSTFTVILPCLLELLTKQDEYATEEDWNIAMAAGSCLKLLSLAVMDPIVPIVLPFIQLNIANPDWRYREAALLSFGSMLEGPRDVEKMTKLVQEATPVVISCMYDGNHLVRDTAAWAVSEICSNYFDSITAQAFESLMQAVIKGFDDNSIQVVAHVCSIIDKIAFKLVSYTVTETNVLSRYMPVLMQKLFATTDKRSEGLDTFKDDAFQTISTVVSSCAKDTDAIVFQVLSETQARLEALTVNPSASTGNIQSKLCEIVGHCIRKLPGETLNEPIVDKLLMLLLQTASTPGNNASSDAFFAIGIIADKVGSRFVRYIDAVQDFLLSALRYEQGKEACESAIDCLGQIADALKDSFVKYADANVLCLIELLKSDVSPKSVKPKVITVLGDIAEAIAGNFQKYIPIVMIALDSAAGVKVTADDDEDQIEFVSLLRSSILESYRGIIHGLLSVNACECITDRVPAISTFLLLAGTDPVTSDDATLSDAVGLLGDLGKIYGVRMKECYSLLPMQQMVIEAIRRANESGDANDPNSPPLYCKRVMDQVLSAVTA